MIQDQPKPNWATLPRPGCVNVEFRVLLGRESIFIANLRFYQNATIDEHDAPYDIDVICMSRSGFASIGADHFEIEAGQTVLWPRGTMHRLWTESDEMETLMVERHAT
jgi:quercetin dioxygenase-like cupin family protein